MERKPWWKSKKVWGTLIAMTLRIVGAHNGWDPDIVNGVANTVFGGVIVEGVVDAGAAFACELRRVR